MVSNLNLQAVQRWIGNDTSFISVHVNAT